MKINILLLTWAVSTFMIISCDKKGQNPLPVLEVLTYSASDVDHSSAKLHGAVKTEGQSAVTQRGFCWSLHQNPSVSDDYILSGFGSGEFSVKISALLPNRKYYFKAFATNGQGTIYGAGHSFFTTQKPYVVGDTGPAGGLIFYVNPSGGGLEAAPASFDTTTNWGCMGALISGTSAAFGMGKENTQKILVCTENSAAAQYCKRLKIKGYADWYLPSKDELDSMCTNLAYKSLGNFSGYRYWSSTEETASNAWWQATSLQSRANTSKSNLYVVRAIRNF